MSAANKLIAKLLNGCHLEKRNDTYVFKCEYPVSWALSVATGSMSNILKGLRKITPSVVGSVIVKHKLIPLPATNRIHAYLCVIPPLKKGGYWYVVVSSWALNKEGVEQVLKPDAVIPYHDMFDGYLYVKRVRGLNNVIKLIKDFRTFSPRLKIGVAVDPSEVDRGHRELCRIIDDVLRGGDGLLMIGDELVDEYSVIDYLTRKWIEKKRYAPLPTNAIISSAIDGKKEVIFETGFYTPSYNKFVPHIKDWRALEETLNEFAQEIMKEGKDYSGKYNNLAYSKVMPRDFNLVMDFMDATGSSVKIIKKGTTSYYIPKKHVVELVTLSRIPTIIHEFTHAADFRTGKLSEKLIDRKLRKEANKLLVKVGFYTDHTHHFSPVELMAELIEVYVLYPKEVRKYPEIERVIKQFLSKTPKEFRRLIEDLRKRNLGKIKKITRKLLMSNSPIIKGLEEKIGNIPPEILMILGKPTAKLTPQEKELLLRYALLAEGKRFLKDIQKQAKHKARYVYTWLEHPTKTDIPGIDTPQTKEKATKLLTTLTQP